MLDAWTTIQRSHAIANSIPVICANRVGFEPSGEGADHGLIFGATALLPAPRANSWPKRARVRPKSLTAQIDMSRTKAVRRNWPFLRDRRIDAYKDLLRLYRD